jgi:hypothetical protein
MREGLSHARASAPYSFHFLTAMYGFFGVQSTNFTVTRIVTESYLARKSQRVRLFDDDKLQISLLGVVHHDTKNEEEKPPDLLYSVTGSQPKAEVLNQLQVSGAVLGSSRCIFFGHILTILRYFDPRACEMIYSGERREMMASWTCSPASHLVFSDTDSILLATRWPDLESCVKPEYANRWSEIRGALFEDANSDKEQSGLLKVAPCDLAQQEARAA